MIKNTTPLSMAESLEYIKNPETKAFVKSFTKLSYKKGKELREKLMALEIIKLNDKHISKLIDTLPQDKEEIIKISNEMNLDEKETNEVLQTIKEYI